MVCHDQLELHYHSAAHFTNFDFMSPKSSLVTSSDYYNCDFQFVKGSPWSCLAGLTHKNIAFGYSAIAQMFPHAHFSKTTVALKTLTSLNKEVRPFFLGDTSIWSYPSVSSLSDCSIWRVSNLADIVTVLLSPAHICRAVLRASQHFLDHSVAPLFITPEKSTLWTDAGLDQNFQRDLRAIGLYEFQGKFVCTNPLVLSFPGNLYGTMALKVHRKSPEAGIGPWTALGNAGPKGYFSLAIIAFGAFGFVVPKY